MAEKTRNREGGYQEALDKLLVKWNVTFPDDKDRVYQVSLRSYNNGQNRPRVVIERAFRDVKTGKWEIATKAEKSIRYEVAVSIVAHATELEKAMEAWSAEDAKRPKDGKRQSDEMPFA